MELPDLLRQAIADGKLREPFSAREAARALALPEWPLPRLHSFLVRHCQGNLAAGNLMVERASYGMYRLLTDAPRPMPGSPGRLSPRRPARRDNREAPNLPGDPES
jgi:hypothetical protein